MENECIVIDPENGLSEFFFTFKSRETFVEFGLVHMSVSAAITFVNSNEMGLS